MNYFFPGMFFNTLPPEWQREQGRCTKTARTVFKFAEEMEGLIAQLLPEASYTHPLKLDFFNQAIQQSKKILDELASLETRLEKQKKVGFDADPRENLKLKIQHQQNQRTHTRTSRTLKVSEVSDKPKAIKTYEKIAVFLRLGRLLCIIAMIEAFKKQGVKYFHRDALQHGFDLCEQFVLLVKNSKFVQEVYPDVAKQLFLSWVSTATIHLYEIGHHLLTTLKMRDSDYGNASIPLYQLLIDLLSNHPHFFLESYSQNNASETNRHYELQTQLQHQAIRCASFQLQQEDGEAAFKLIIARAYPIIQARKDKPDVALERILQLYLSYIVYSLMEMLKKNTQSSEAEKMVLHFWETGEITGDKMILIQTVMAVFKTCYEVDGLLDMDGIRLKYTFERKNLFESFKTYFSACLHHENPKVMIASCREAIQSHFATDAKAKKPLRSLTRHFELHHTEAEWKAALQKDGLPVAHNRADVVYTAFDFYEKVFYPYITLVESNFFPDEEDLKVYAKVVQFCILHIQELNMVIRQSTFDFAKSAHYFLEQTEKVLTFFQEIFKCIPIAKEQELQKNAPHKRARKKAKLRREQRKASQSSADDVDETETPSDNEDESADEKEKSALQTNPENLEERLAQSKLSEAEVSQHLHTMRFGESPSDVLAQLGKPLFPQADEAVQKIVGGQALLWNAFPMVQNPVEGRIKWVTPALLDKVVRTVQLDHTFSTVLEMMLDLTSSLDSSVLTQHGVASDALKEGLQWDLDVIRKRHEHTEHNQADIDAALVRRKEMLTSSGRQHHPDGPSPLTCAAKWYQAESSLIGETRHVLETVNQALTQQKKKVR